MTTINYDTMVSFEGRNGMFKQSGIDIMITGDGQVALQPITSKMQPGRCWVEIPMGNLDDVIEALKAIKIKNNEGFDLDKAAHYLCDEDLLRACKSIQQRVNDKELDEDDLLYNADLEDDDGETIVSVWEKVQNTMTVGEFLNSVKS